MPKFDQPRYRSRKIEIRVCRQDMQFTYVLTCWKALVHDGQVLMDAITRPYRLKVPNGK